MAYISKKDILAAYKKLSEMHPDPNAQGATQKVSAIRHFLALDRFYKLYARDCNTRDRNDREEFARLVGVVSDVCLDFYTTNFYFPLKQHNGDYSVGSNFYSAGQVSASMVNPQGTFDYPKRGGTPLLKIQNGVLIRDVALYNNFNGYILSSDYAVALVLWIIRKINVEIDNGLTVFQNVYNSLSEKFTSELMSVLFDEHDDFENILDGYDLSFNDNFYSIKVEDINLLFNSLSNISQYNNTPRQIIYYGAPGTGKSHKIKERLESENVPKENIFRTTFHPDSDYSTFVGAYKPTRGKKPLYGLNGSNTVRLHNNGEDLTEEVITYKFVPQAFLKAYIRAYEKPAENVYLIIEEINRGNCAQIFGDLFQLLDRDKDGMSDYTIKADDDLKDFLEERFKELNIGNDGIADGELCLPSNLYIYATMNTSDQSLFPIDSAFKRRWDWEYEPIKYNHDLKIKIGNEAYKWTSFQKIVNGKIKDATSSEDKMLGDYFVNPNDSVIDENTLRNKILFYLWNDVCKDGEGDIFKISETEDISFSELYGDKGRFMLNQMMNYLKVEKYADSSEDEDDEDDDFPIDEENDDSSMRDASTRYSINNGPAFQKTYLAYEVFNEYTRLNPNLSASEVLTKWKDKMAEWKKGKQRVPKHLIENEPDYNSYISDSKGDKKKNERRFETLEYKGEKFYLWKGWGDGAQDNITPFMEAINSSDWGITITRVK